LEEKISRNRRLIAQHTLVSCDESLSLKGRVRPVFDYSRRSLHTLLAFLWTTLIQDDEVHRHSRRVSDLQRRSAVHNRRWAEYNIHDGVLNQIICRYLHQLSLSVTAGTPLMNMRCRCIQTHSKPPIPAGKILSLKMTPAGPQCRNEEIMW